jgi:small-conductance mechanosensitive channel
LDSGQKGYVTHDFVTRLHARFNDEGIVIPFPIRTIAHRREEPETEQTAERTAGAA